MRLWRTWVVTVNSPCVPIRMRFNNPRNFEARGILITLDRCRQPSIPRSREGLGVPFSLANIWHG